MVAHNRPGLSTEPGLIHTGQNSGYQAINLAFLFGARKIVLVGFDMQHTGGRHHWFGNHPLGMRNACGVDDWKKNFPKLAADLQAQGVDVVNCSEETALTCFRRSSLEQEL